MKQFIITDPCYIIAEPQYRAIGEALNWGEFTEMHVPSTYRRRDYTLEKEGKISKDMFTMHRIEGTPHGDGSYDYGKQHIGVDAGMLCIAECEKGWEGEDLGATFETLADAQDAFPGIIRQV